MNPFLITGMSRSGTTLLTKMLASHDGVDVLSQPFPLLYRHFKEKFFAEINYPETYYVLNNLFNERIYEPADFFRFLERAKIKSSEMVDILKEMKGWSGQWTLIDNWEWLNNFDHFNLIDLYKVLLDNYADTSCKTQGTKEVLIEEFIPYFRAKGIKVLLIIRDPRDVITSLNVGKGTDYAGDHRPILFHLRNWRKSVAIANSFEDNNNLLVLRYEDLIESPLLVINQVADFLNVSHFEEDYFNEGIPDSEGNIWKGNSSNRSFSGIDQTNKQKYKKYLDDETLKYIEYMCLPEMKFLNYSLEFDVDDEYNPADFIEPWEIKGDLKNFGTNKEVLGDESNRLKLLRSNSASSEEIISYFVTNNNFNKLKEVIK